jgi:hypothetical protein
MFRVLQALSLPPSPKLPSLVPLVPLPPQSGGTSDENPSLLLPSGAAVSFDAGEEVVFGESGVPVDPGVFVVFSGELVDGASVAFGFTDMQPSG